MVSETHPDRDLYERLGQVIASVRRLRGLSQSQLADFIGASTITIGQYESGRRGPSYGRLILLCNALQIRPSTLIRRAFDDKWQGP